MSTCEKCADLEEEVRYWKDEAQRNATAETRERIRRALDLTTAEAWLVGTLYAARGSVVRRERIEEDIPGSKTWEERLDPGNIICVMVSRIRAALGSDSIRTVRGTGYAASEKLIARIDGFAK